MKKVFAGAFILAVVVTCFNACKKNNGQVIPIVPDPRFPLPFIIKDTTAHLFISGNRPGDFKGKVIVGMYYGNEVVASNVDLVVIRNGKKDNAKVLKAGIVNFPQTVEVTGMMLTNLFDSTITMGDVFEIGADVTTSTGQKFPGFPLTGVPYNADTSSLVNSSFSVSYVATCTFDKSDFNGFYKVLANTWDYKAGDSVEVRPGTGNEILITAWPNPDVGNFTRIPMRVIVDPVTNAATVPLQMVGEFAGGVAHVIDEGSGTVSPCGDSIALSLMFMVGTYYGEVPLLLGK